MAYNKIIRADDPQAVSLLKENLEVFENRRAYMQKINDYFKANGTTRGCEGVSMEQAAELDSHIGKYNQELPYPGKFFNDNFKEIRAIKGNIERLQNKPETVFKGWSFNGGEAVINLANNRLQLVFAQKPNEQLRETLKKSGFHWARTQEAWQIPLTYKSMAAVDRIDAVKPLNGRKASELQPPKPERNTMER